MSTSPDLGALLERIQHDRGVVHPNLAIAAKYSPAALEQFHTSYMWAVHGNEVLDRKTKELIMLAADAAVYFTYGCKFHIGEALRHGASVDEIVASLELVGLVGGFHVPMMAFPLLDEVLATEEFAHLRRPDLTFD
ncbi:carboxymuconolactone decarboxylase family protein [Kineosporia succinea]|uniref:Alkylhydroperoxidase/carboxymuconolactone decarboxylase family protein YurZ n=1 Tax=Kineosporia succinea TaxID=84632 RepID=A0ABT9PC97_9ACTN|nr:carboxymuconolactone decarboxylase family protein [Kineosporia succinea]MDP9830313.1 alkylhydroperoxidase/carboxymuconolactone decarboxylase family protein YurZ [Kineosporia succinea]